MPLPASNTCCVVLIAAWLPQPEDKVVASADLTLHAGVNREGILPEREDPTTYAIWSSSSDSVSLSVFAIVITTVENFAISFTAKPLTAVAEIALCNREPVLFLSHWIGILSGLRCGLPVNSMRTVPRSCQMDSLSLRRAAPLTHKANKMFTQRSNLDIA